MVASAAGRSHGPASQPNSPALGPNTTVKMRQYAPTLDMIANSAATGAAATP
jgi:hypothetical protein